MRGVADEDHRGFCAERLDATGERLVRHVVLHDVDERLVGALLLARELVERDDVPVADQADASVGVVDEELRDGDLATGDEHPVGRELREDVGLAGALGAELDEVVVALDERDQAHELEELAATAEQFGVEPDGLHEQVDPLIGGEPATRLEVTVEVEVRQLDGLDRAEDPRHDALVFAVEVLDVADAPDAADEELGVRLDRRRTRRSRP